MGFRHTKGIYSENKKEQEAPKTVETPVEEVKSETVVGEKLSDEAVVEPVSNDKSNLNSKADVAEDPVTVDTKKEEDVAKQKPAVKKKPTKKPKTS